MKATANYRFIEEYLPSKRHRIMRYRETEGTAKIEIREIDIKDAPVALRANAHFRKKEYRLFENKLFVQSDYRSYCSGAEGLYPISEFIERLKHLDYSNYNQDEISTRLKELSDRYIIMDNELWETASEPRYVCATFGLGHNHGGTALMIDDCYNPNINKNCYFNAHDFDKAVAYAKKTALKRGDTNSIESIENAEPIEVLIPEVIKCNPQLEAGDGCPFINSLEALIDNSGDSFEAGAMVVAKTIAKVNEGRI